MNGPKKLKVILPDDVARDLEIIKLKLNLKTFSSTIGIAIKILAWILSKQNEGYVIKAEREIGNKSIVSELPPLLEDK